MSKMILPTQKENELMDLLTHIDRFIHYYDPEAFKEMVGDKRYISYSQVEDFVIKNTLMKKKRYTEETFNHFWYDGIKEDDPLFDGKVNKENVTRDMNVTRQEIEFLYIMKNWELDKNALTVRDMTGLYTPDEAMYYNRSEYQTTFYIPENQSWADNLLFFKEKRDSHIVAIGITDTETERSPEGKFLLSIIFSNNEKSDERTKNPFMMLTRWVHYSSNELFIDSIKKSFDGEVDEEHEEFKNNLTTFAIIIGKVHSEAVAHPENIEYALGYKKAFDLNNIKNQYKEIRRGILAK